MSWNKKLMQGIAVTVSTFTLLSGTVVSGSEITQTPADTKPVGGKATAGIVASLERTAAASIENGQLQSAALLSASDEPQEQRAETAAQRETEEQEARSKELANELSKTEQKWQDKVMADVDDALCIRAKGEKDASIVGMMYPTSVATVIKKGASWTKIQSGDVEGYVNNEYLIFGSEAYAHAKKVCKKYAHVKTDGLRVRQKANEEATILTLTDKGEKLLFDKKAKVKDGWVAVCTEDGNGYVSEDYVVVKLGTTDALSIEEIEAQQAKEAAEEAARKAAQQAETANEAASTQHAAVSAAASDVTLLAAIIQCEAGGEPYRGQVAVGSVVMNRVRSSSFPNSISSVIYQGGQFSPVGNGALARVLASGNIYSSCIQAAQEALAGADTTGGKLYFRRVNGRSGLVIGNHVFY